MKGRGVIKQKRKTIYNDDKTQEITEKQNQKSEGHGSPRKKHGGIIMRIQHNIAALNSYRNLTVNNSAVSKNLEKLSSGYRINRAGDDAAGLAISEKMRAQITGLKTAQKNANDGISLVQTAEGAMTEIHSMLNRMVELANQSANGTYADEVDRENLQKEVTSLKDEINRIADSTNFNGINLLDGSLSSKGSSASNIVINGIGSSKSAGLKGSYEASDAWGTANVAFKENDTFKYTVSLDNGESHTVTLKAQKDNNGNVTKMVGDSGQVYTITSGAATVAQVSDAVLGELNKTSLGKSYNITQTAGKFKLEALEEGTDTPTVQAMDAEWTEGGTEATASQSLKIGVTTVQPRDVGREIDKSQITLYNGKNYDDAVFSINGHKFVVMVGDMDANTLGESGTAMNATLGLGSDVTVLISDGTNKGIDKADKNFDQNIAKIAEVTGLTVTASIDEATPTGAAANMGIRLSRGKESGGLQLQIGDTSDDFNKMRVSVSDMHTKAMGINDIDISTQQGASDAVDKIKAAINYVSSTRGDLGAIQNRLEHTINNLSVATENMTAAESRIRDVDMAEEMMAYTKNNILVQASQAMLAQANQIPQGVLQLLQ